MVNIDNKTKRLLLLYAGGNYLNSENVESVSALDGTRLKKTFCYKVGQEIARTRPHGLKPLLASPEAATLVQIFLEKQAAADEKAVGALVDAKLVKNSATGKIAITKKGEKALSDFVRAGFDESHMEDTEDLAAGTKEHIKTRKENRITIPQNALKDIHDPKIIGHFLENRLIHSWELPKHMKTGASNEKRIH
ncbi:MAG: hypothetical protein WC408_00445 [Candidatus Micrarchaeia archaeon]|jgi:hypothetical protein